MVHFIRENKDVVEYDSLSQALDQEIFYDNVIIVDHEIHKTFVYNQEGILEKTVG